MNKQIEDMSEFLWDVQSREDEIEIYNTEALAKRLVDASYRKASDVAREIFAEIKQYFIVKNLGLLNATYTKDFFRELQKKYEREEANDETDT